eukprot:28401-Pelagococcus_subviridis.AAC.16
MRLPTTRMTFHTPHPGSRTWIATSATSARLSESVFLLLPFGATDEDDSDARTTSNASPMESTFPGAGAASSAATASSASAASSAAAPESSPDAAAARGTTVAARPPWCAFSDARATTPRGDGGSATLADPAPRLEGDGGGDDRGIETLAPRPIRRAMTFGRDAARAGDDACAMTTVRTTRRRRRRRRVARAEQ